MSVSTFSTHVPSRIELTKRVSISLYRIAGQDDAVIRDFCKTMDFDHFGVLFLNYENYAMARSFPMLFNVTVDHSTDELKYVDGQALTDTIIELLEAELSKNGFDLTVVKEFRILGSSLLRTTPGPVELPAMVPNPSTTSEDERVANIETAQARAAAGQGVGEPFAGDDGNGNLADLPPPMGDDAPSFIVLEDASIVRIGGITKVDPETADGYFEVIYKVTPNAAGVTTNVFFQFDNSEWVRQYKDKVQWFDLANKFAAHVAKWYLANTRVGSLYFRCEPGTPGAVSPAGISDLNAFSLPDTGTAESTSE